jgi:hypothetical protein
MIENRSRLAQWAAVSAERRDVDMAIVSFLGQYDLSQFASVRISENTEMLK